MFASASRIWQLVSDALKVKRSTAGYLTIDVIISNIFRTKGDLKTKIRITPKFQAETVFVIN